MSSLVPEGWVFCPIGNHIEVLTDYTANGSFASLKENVQYFNEKSYAALVRTTDLEKSTFCPQRFTDKQGYEFLEKSSLKCGDIVIANVGSAGKAYRVPDANMPMTLAPNMYLVKFCKSMDNNFAFQVITNEKFYSDLMLNVGSSTLNAINKSNFRSISIFVPPLPEQKKIASILTSVDKVIENTQKQIDKLQDLKKATMNELLTRGIGHTEFKNSELGPIPRGWEVGEVSIYCEEVFLGLTSKVDYVDSGGVPLIRATDISKGRLSFEKVRCISEAQHQKLTKYRQASRGDILVSKSGSLGVCAIVDTDKEFSIYESIIVLKPIESKLQSQYLLWFMRSPLTQQQLQGDKVGSTVGHLNLNDFRNLKITIPSLIEQNLISQQIVAMNELEKSLEQKLQQTQSLKKSLMQELLTGKVRVTVN